MAKQPAIVAAGRQSREDAADGALTEEQKTLCAELGVKEEDFKAQLAARKEAGL
jgi:hypothetical protein